MVYVFYTTYISVDLAHHEIFHAKVDKGGIINVLLYKLMAIYKMLCNWYTLDPFRKLL